MPENNFEKQMQDIFSDMRIKPSAEVWSKVHERVKKDHGRKWRLLWMAAAAMLVLGTGAYWLMSSSETAEKPGNLTQTEKKVNASHDSNLHAPSVTDQPETSAVNQKDLADVQKSGSANEQQQINPTSASQALKLQTLANNEKADFAKTDRQLQLIAAGENIGKNNQTEITKYKKNTTDNAVVTGQHAKPDQLIKAGDIKTIKSGDQNNEVAITGFLQTVNTDLPALVGKTSLDPTSLNKNLKPIVKLTPRKKWEFGIGLSAGVAALGKGLAKDIFSEKPLENNLVSNSAVVLDPMRPTDLNNYLNIIGGGGTLVAAMPPPASPVKHGFAYQAGGFAKLHVSDQLAFTGGLEYVHNTTRREVGREISYDLVNLAPDQFNNARFTGTYNSNMAPAPENTMYTNQYHYLQLPVGVEWQAVKGLPVTVNTGLSVGYMIHTNAIHYKSVSGLYFQDKALFNNLQGGIYAGINIKLLQSSGAPLNVGPVVQYNYTSLTKNVSESKQNFMYAGLKLQWVLANTK